MKTYFRILSYVKPYGRFVLPFSLFSLTAVFFSIFQFTLLIPFLNFLFDPATSGETIKYLSAPRFALSATYFKDYFYYKMNLMSINNKVYVLYYIALLMIVSVILSNLFRYLAEKSLVRARTFLVKNLRQTIFEKVNHLHIGYFTKENKGDLSSRMNSDVFEIEYVASSSLEILFKEPYLIIGYFITLFVISSKLTLFTFLIIPLSGICIAMVTKKLKKSAQQTQASMGRLAGIIDETLSGMRIIRSFNATNYIINKFKKENSFYFTANLKSFARRELAPAISESAGVIVVAAILVYGGALILNNDGGLKGGEFVTYLVIISQIIRPIKSIVVSLANIQRAQSAGERIFQVIDTPVEVKDIADALNFKGLNRSIEFRNVSFAYNSKPVLKDLNFSIEKGKTIALVGPSGAGKSTIADLIPRFYDVTNGQINIDGKDIRSFTMESLRSRMSFVTQDTFLFNDTIFNNIALGFPDATKEDVIAAASIANAHEFIMLTENGYQTNIGDRGIRLSGGQRQRISIARAVFKNPEILILDEATSALDSESEKLVQDALNKLMAGRTTLIIAHRLSTIKDADEILVIEDGTITERGSHDELIEKNEGIYIRLNSIQNKA